MEQLTSINKPKISLENYVLKPNFNYCKKCWSRRNDYLNEFNECGSCEKCERCKNQRRDYLNEFRICNSCCKQMEQMTPSSFKPNFKFECCMRCYHKKDYLNEFQICNSCCKQMEQMTPTDFKPNFKFESCKRCYNQEDYLNEFQICNSCCKQMEQMTPTGLKPNFKFESCKRCHHKRDYLNEYNDCNSCEKCKRCNNQRDYLNEFQFCNSCCKKVEQMTPSGFKPNFKFERCKECNKLENYLNEFNECVSCEKCKRCYSQRRDYLNEFQICNSCCKQMEQMTPAGFKPNFKFESCKRCYCKRDYLNEFQFCNSCCKQMEQMTPAGFKPNFKFESCEECWSRNDYINEYNECDSCEKCKRCKNQRRDYLNKFQVCSSCCKQMEQMTPAGFKPNFKFESCKRCHYKNDYLNEFQICNSCCKQMEQMMTPAGFKPNFTYKNCMECYRKRDYLNEYNECNSCEKCKRCNDQKRDYLNEFQICNLCCKQIEQMTPSIFKPNFKFENCKRCNNQRKDYLNEFQICNSCSSGNKVVDDFLISQVDGWIGMEYIPYNRIKNVEFIAEGGFSKIYRATWINSSVEFFGSRETTVVLKELDNSKNIDFRKLNELKMYYNLGMNHYISKYYGITQDPKTQNFMIVIDYYKSGDLSCYLTNKFFYISWHIKLSMLKDIITGLKVIHDANIIHKDYHSGNIFISNQYNLFNNNGVVTGDLGISKSAIESLDDDGDNAIYGIIPYVAPEIFQGQKYTKASDIYSFGMIMWELMTGRRPFWDQSHDTDLIIEICDGFRPPIITNVPKGYAELMEECWHFDPNKRLMANEVYSKIINIMSNEYENPTTIIYSSDIGPVKANNSGAIYKSRYLSAMIKSAKSTISLRSQKITSKFDLFYDYQCNNSKFLNDKRKFDNDPIEDKTIKKTKLFEDKNNGYLTRELVFDIVDDRNSSKFNNDDYITREIVFDI